MKNNNTLYIVVPCYNEEEVLPLSAPVFVEKIRTLRLRGAISNSSRVLFVNDGSKDRTWELMCELSREYEEVCGIQLSRNSGHQNALLAGMSTAVNHADMIVTIDADLQDDIHCIDQMVSKCHEGYEVIYGVRSSRKTDTRFKRETAQLYYKALKFLGADIVYNHADYRLMSKRACKALLSYPEANVFLRGMVRLVGYKSTTVEYERTERLAGESKYPLKKMILFGLDGITSFSIKPVRGIFLFGCATFAIMVAYVIYTLIGYLMGNTVSGWASLIISIWLFGSAILISIGVVGEYIGKIYMETKQRPKFFIESEVGSHEEV